jgi:hypothetical protein
MPNATTTFPTLKQVEKASRFDLCRWYRFLPSAETEEHTKIQKRIYDRTWEMGGFTPEISKALG